MAEQIERLSELWINNTIANLQKNTIDTGSYEFELENLCFTDPLLALRVIIFIVKSIPERDLY